MAAISVDVAGILQEIRTTIQTIKGAKDQDKKAKQDARRTIFQALSMHPALDHMNPPERHLNDADWYDARGQKRKGPLLKDWMKSTSDVNEHFEAAAGLGPVGTRARIMILFLWLLGNRLSDDKRKKLISTTIAHGLASKDQHEANLSELLTLSHVQAVVGDLARMIGQALPIDPSLNPFGEHYIPKVMEEDRIEIFDLPDIPSDWERYDWDIKGNPTLLLQRSMKHMKQTVIVPQTRLSLLLLRYATQIYGLGNIIATNGVKEDAFWNTALPLDVIQRSSNYESESKDERETNDPTDRYFASLSSHAGPDHMRMNIDLAEFVLTTRPKDSDLDRE
ncbi:hypothetical protein H0H92_007229 [Tricholoma furcatifolium]|nr:hypothetical protein H0H92_007229 [Tricholoma furcatifolium]